MTFNKQIGKATVIALPGFLGRPEDWTSIIPDAVVPDIPILPFWESAKWLNMWALSYPPPRMLVGYSQGGRLALHALVLSPEVWDRAVILSAHTGLKTEASKQKRRIEDLRWAKRFEVEDWESLLLEWNRRGSLSSSQPIQRIESVYSRKNLSRSLDRWSLGRQDDLQAAVEALNIPFLWFVGERDLSFLKVAQDLKFSCFDSTVVVAPNSGHRLLSDNPKFIKEYFFKSFFGCS